MVVLNSKTNSKFSISKWSFVNWRLFKSLELTKYIIYSHRTKTLMSRKTWWQCTFIHKGSHLVSWWWQCTYIPIMCTLLPSSLFCAKNKIKFRCSSFHHSTILHTHTMAFFFPLLHNPMYTVHYLAFASSHHCTSLHSILFWHLHTVVVFYCDYASSHSITSSSTSLGCFFIVSTCFTFLRFSLLCSFLFVHGDHHHPVAEGLSPFKGSSFLSPYLHCYNFFLVVFACFLVLLGLLQVVVFYYKHQRLVFPLFFLLFVATFFFLLLLLLFLFLLLTSISNMTWFIYVDVVLCVGCVLYV